jgi:hypothetical protein
MAGSPVSSNLQNTFHNAVTVFNNTFTHSPPYTPAELNNFGQFYDDNIKVITPSQRPISSKQSVLSDFAQSSPLSFGPNFTNLVIDEPSRSVKGDGPFKDTDKGVPGVFQIHFEFKYVLKPEGWIITGADSRRI